MADGPASWLPATHLVELVDRAAARWGTDHRVAALLTWKRYVHEVALPLALGWAGGRCVPLVDAGHVRVRHDASGLHVAMAAMDVAVLPRDPCAGMPGTIVVPDEAALLAAARGALVDRHLALVAAALRRLTPVSERALRGSLAAALARPLAALPGEAAALVAGIGPDLTALIDLTPDGTLRRRTCCLSWAVPGLGACASCPRRAT